MNSPDADPDKPQDWDADCQKMGGDEREPRWGCLVVGLVADDDDYREEKDQPFWVEDPPKGFPGLTQFDLSTEDPSQAVRGGRQH